MDRTGRLSPNRHQALKGRAGPAILGQHGGMNEVDPEVVRRWQECADLVAADVARTTDLTGAWRVEVRDDEDALSADLRAGTRHARGPAYRSHLRITFGAPRERPRVPLLRPEIWLVAGGVAEILLSPDVVEIADGVREIAAKVQHEVIDELWTAWPVCPGHAHPAEVGGSEWMCPTSRSPIAEIGRLSR